MKSHTNKTSPSLSPSSIRVIVSGSEDGTAKIWENDTYSIENTLSYAVEGTWCVALRNDANKVAVGSDEGVIVLLQDLYSL